MAVKNLFSIFLLHMYDSLKKSPLCCKGALKLVSSITEEMIFTSIKKNMAAVFSGDRVSS